MPWQLILLKVVQELVQDATEKRSQPENRELPFRHYFPCLYDNEQQWAPEDGKLEGPFSTMLLH